MTKTAVRVYHAGLLVTEGRRNWRNDNPTCHAPFSKCPSMRALLGLASTER
jgi:hypothetical protein